MIFVVVFVVFVSEFRLGEPGETSKLFSRFTKSAKTLMLLDHRCIDLFC